ncbi:hypothetical protein JQ620_25720 [Bradyrhizobium sp. AUGA SZCCT0274]|nr:hypothetical protein [Bradyrhizobium sp. AUGA SZCCT0160]MBR1243497.1 hypothetical protein [Bradyrhizobium sp. AUGA SZCCT0274]
MYVVALDNRQFGQHLNMTTGMYRPRRVFKDRLDCAVSVSGDQELDVYDVLNPANLLVMSVRVISSAARVSRRPRDRLCWLTRSRFTWREGRAVHRKMLGSSRFCVHTSFASELAESGYQSRKLRSPLATSCLRRGASRRCIATPMSSVRSCSHPIRSARWPSGDDVLSAIRGTDR